MTPEGSEEYNIQQCFPLSAFRFAGDVAVVRRVVRRAAGLRGLRDGWGGTSTRSRTSRATRSGMAPGSGFHDSVLEVGLATSREVTGLEAWRDLLFRSNGHQRGRLNPTKKSAEITYAVPAALFASVPRDGWTVVADSEESGGYPAAYAIDGDPNTFWHTAWRTGGTPLPHELRLDLGIERYLCGFSYLPRQDAYLEGSVTRWEFYVGADGRLRFAGGGGYVHPGGKSLKTVEFAAKTRSDVMLRVLDAVAGCAAAAELGLLDKSRWSSLPGARSNTPPI